MEQQLMETTVVILYLALFLVAVLGSIYSFLKCKPGPELEERAETTLAAREAHAAQATAIQSEEQAALPAVLPYFTYAAQEQGRASESLCAICLEPLRQGQLCSEVPACCHAFHRDCLGVWAKSKGTCPLCRAKIVPGSDGVVDADDIV